MRPLAPIALAAAAVAACGASLPIERREYILSRPHGWIELTVEDGAIPLVPSSDEDPTLARPGACWLAVHIDREPFVDGALYPDGESAPFRASSGFRFPVPIGTLDIEVDYRDCRVGEDGKKTFSVFETTVDVAESMVTDLAFDGISLRGASPRADRAVTLERIYDAVSEGRSAP